MFWRLVFQLLRRSRGRFAVAIFAIVSGATVISALLNLDLGVQNKLTQEFRTLGANIVIIPPRCGDNRLHGGSAAPKCFLSEGVVQMGIERFQRRRFGFCALPLHCCRRRSKTRRHCRNLMGQLRSLNRRGSWTGGGLPHATNDRNVWSAATSRGNCISSRAVRCG